MRPQSFTHEACFPTSQFLFLQTSLISLISCAFFHSGIFNRYPNLANVRNVKLTHVTPESLVSLKMAFNWLALLLPAHLHLELQVNSLSQLFYLFTFSRDWTDFKNDRMIRQCVCCLSSTSFSCHHLDRC